MIRGGLATAIAGMIAAFPALAHHQPGHDRPTNGPNAVSVPEIDASAGLLAIGAIAAVLLFLWERNRRKAN